MIGEALDGDVPLANADDSLDDADVDLVAVERAPLLDVQFEVGKDVALAATRAREVVGIAAEEGDAVADRLAAAAHGRELGGGEIGRHRVTPPEAPLFILEDHDFNRMVRHHALLAERLRHLDRPHGADVAIVVAPFGHGVDVRPEEDRLERRIGPSAAADDVAGGVDGDIELGVAHEFHHVRTGCLVGVAVG